MTQNNLSLGAVMEPELPWPSDLEADVPPADDFELSKVWRRMNRELAAAERLSSYLAMVTAQVRSAIAARKAKAEELRGLALTYLQESGRTSVQLPDLGTIYTTTRQQVRIDEAATLAWAEEHGRNFILLEPTLDKDGLKRHVLATGEVLPGVEVESVTSVAFRSR